MTETPGFPSSTPTGECRKPLGDPGAIGSGADAFDLLDDPHWPERRAG
jgi:hypothetical protein